MPLTPGARLGPYEVISPLGAGGMGEVYRARDTKLGRDVAIKILPAGLASDPDRLARFEREARTLAQLNHPNIAQLHGLDDTDGHRALVMELVSGEDLSTRIAKGPMPIDEARSVARQIADALAAAHDTGIVHRDLKPANVKLRDDGTVKVLDFGLAKLTDVSRVGEVGQASKSADLSPTITSPAMTAVGIILGTAAYMSPEQAKGRTVDKRADIWAFGCVLYEMLTGRRAFPGDDVSETLATVIKSEPDWNALPAGTPASIRRLLRRTLDKQPSRRLADIADAMLELDEEADPSLPAAQMTSRSSRLWRLGWFAAGIAITGTVGFVATRLQPAIPPAVVRFSLAYEGILRGFDVSPDGQTIAYAAAVPGGRSGVWTRRVDSEMSTLLPDTNEASAPFWSPDGRSIAFFSGTRLRRLDIDGRSARTIAESGAGLNRRGSWATGGVIVFTNNQQVYYTVPSEGGQPTEIIPPASMRGRVTNARVASNWVFLVARDIAGAAETWAVRFDGSDGRKVTDGSAEFVPPDHLLIYRSDDVFVQQVDVSTFERRGPAKPLGLGVIRGAAVRGDTMVMQSGSVAVPSELTWFDRSGKTLGVVGEVGDHFMPRLSPDGTKLAVETHGGEGGGDIFVYDLTARTRVRLTFEPTHHNAGSTWSPDSSRLAFHSTRQGMSVFIKPVSGASPESLVFESNSANPVDWSGDGRFLLIDRTVSSQPGIYRLPISGSSKPEPVLIDPKVRAFQGQLSPDGTLLAYVLDERPGGEVYVSPYPPTGAKWQVSIKGGNSPRWNRNGKELFYVSPERAIMSVPVATKGTFSSGTPIELFRSSIRPLSADWYDYDVTSDGNRFIVVSLRETTSEPLRVIANWRSLLAGR